MTSAPADLQEVQAYAHTQTGQPWASLGIIHSTPQGGGYHEGEDLLIAAGTAPGPQYPGDDYSYTDAPARDLLPTGRLAGGNYASAFDFGGDFPRFLAFNAWMRGRLLAGDPRTGDIREMIYTLDGHTVHRIDRTGVQGDSGDDSHLSHTHFSFYRDSVGRRSRSDNFLGLLREFFEGKTQQEDDMSWTDVIYHDDFGDHTATQIAIDSWKGIHTVTPAILATVKQTAADVASLSAKVEKLATGGVDLGAFVEALRPIIRAEVRAAEHDAAQAEADAVKGT